MPPLLVWTALAAVAGLLLYAHLARGARDAALHGDPARGRLGAPRAAVIVKAFGDVSVRLGRRTMRLCDEVVGLYGIPAGRLRVQVGDVAADVELQPGAIVQIDAARMSSGRWDLEVGAPALNVGAPVNSAAAVDQFEDAVADEQRRRDQAYRRVARGQRPDWGPPGCTWRRW